MIRTTALMAALALSLGACGDRSASNFPIDAGLPGTAIPTNPAADPTSPAYFRESIGDRVLFAVDQSTLDDAARATLAGQARWLAANPEYSAVVEGHADEQGTREYNLALGARRANAAQEFLLSQGVAAGRVTTVSYGKERPVEICSDEACYTRNRRAVTVLSAGAGF